MYKKLYMEKIFLYSIIFMIINFSKLFIFSLLYVSTVHASAGQNKTIEVSAFKAVYLEIPEDYKIELVKKGMNDNYFVFEQINDRMLLLKAMPNVKFPTTNVTLYCGTALFVADVRLNHATTNYHYKFSKEEAIPIHGGEASNVQKESRAKEPLTPKASTTQDSLTYDLNHLPVKMDYFQIDRMASGLSLNSENVLAYTNNLLNTENHIFLSVKIVNQSNVPFKTDGISFFLTSRQNKKRTSLKSSAPEILSYEQINAFKNVVSPKSKYVYIYRLERFTLNRQNELKVAISEEGGKRSLDYKINAKVFYKKIHYVK